MIHNGDFKYKNATCRTLAHEIDMPTSTGERLPRWQINLAHACLGVIDDILCYGEIYNAQIGFLARHTNSEKWQAARRGE